MRKMVQIAPTSMNALEILESDTGKSFQELMDEAIADLRVKVAEDYIHKDRFVETVEQMMSLLERIENKLDKKADKP